MVPKVKSVALSERQFCAHPHPVEGYLAISEDIFVLLVSSGQRPGVAKHPTMHRTVLQQRVPQPKMSAGASKEPQ